MGKIAVIGIGKLGLCIALQLERAGYEVLGIDVRADYVDAINRKALLCAEPGVEAALRSSVQFRATSQLSDIAAFCPFLIYIVVATPTATDGYDHSGLNRVLAALYALRLPGARQDLVVISTTLPGYCDSRALEAEKHHCFLSNKPEFVAQGSIMHDLQYPDQVLVGAADHVAADKIIDVHKRVCLSKPEFFRVSRLSAEIAKLATNCFLIMKIAFANAIGDLCQQTGAETEQVLAMIGADSRIGNKFLRYGFGYGGPCFPRDNLALAGFAERQQMPWFLLEATAAANRQHLDFQVAEYLLKHDPQEPIHFESVTYKLGTDVLEHSQPLALAERLAQAGRRVIVHETESVVEGLKTTHGDLFEYKVVSRKPEESFA